MPHHGSPEVSARLTIGVKTSIIQTASSIRQTSPVAVLGKVLAPVLRAVRSSLRVAPRRPTLPLQVLHVASRLEVRMKSILDPTFRYTSSANTDLRKTFARIRRENRRQTQAGSREGTEPVSPKVTPIFRGQRPAA
jgi:hypothetical protein